MHRSEQVPGCSLDAELSPKDHLYNAHWQAPEFADAARAGSKKLGDNAVNFNSKQLYSPVLPVQQSQFSAAESALYEAMGGCGVAPCACDRNRYFHGM